MIRLSEIRPSINSQIVIQDNVMKNEYKQAYLPFTLKFQDKSIKTAALLDTGAAISVIEVSFLNKLFPSESEEDLIKRINPTNVQASSLTHNINSLGSISVNIQLTHKHSSPVQIDLIVIKLENPPVCPIILGLFTYALFDLTLSFKSDNGKNIPILHTKNKEIVKLHYMSESELLEMNIKVRDLPPKHSTSALAILPNLFYGIEKEKILINAYNHYISNDNFIEVTASTNNVSYNKKLNKWTTSAIITNYSPTFFTGTFCSSFEYIHNYDIIQITEETIKDPRINLLTNIYPSNKFTDNHLTVDFQANVNKLDNLQQVPKKLFKISAPTNNIINNGLTDLSKSLTETRSSLQLNGKFKTNSEKQCFLDKKNTIHIGPDYNNVKEITDDDILPVGFEIPPDKMVSPESIVNVKSFPKDIQPYIQAIFLEEYPKVIARFSMDTGNLSNTLGTFKMRLKEGAVLPQFKSSYYNDVAKSKNLKTLLEFMLKSGVIIKAPPGGDSLDNFCSPAYLVPRANPGSPGRLVVDNKAINHCISMPSQNLPAVDTVLSQLANKSIFSKTDFSQAYYSVKISKDSQKYTTFSAGQAAYRFTCLPTGLHASPEIWNRFVDRMIHYEVSYDENGKLKTENGLPIMHYSPIKEVQLFYDDLIIATEWMGSWKQSLDHHFTVIRRVMKRIAFHSGKISFKKSEFAKTRISFLGWFIGNNYLVADDRRIEKVITFPLPQNAKKLKTWIGILKSLILALGFTDLLPMCNYLHNLTRPSVKFQITPEYEKVFNEIKTQLTTAPIYSRLIDIEADKILISDSSSTEHGAMGAVLCQIVKPLKKVNYVPDYIFLEDPCHQKILEYKLLCQPLLLRNTDETLVEYKRRLEAPHPPPHSYMKSEYRGYNENNYKNSLKESIDLLMNMHNCTQGADDLNKLLKEQLSTTMIRAQLLDFHCHNNKQLLKNYMENILKGKWEIDDYLCIIESLSAVLQRTIVIISSRDKDKDKPIKYFNPDKTRPTFFLMLYETTAGLITRPAYLNKKKMYDMSMNRGKFEIISYFSKKIPESRKSAHIMHLEFIAILSALENMKKYIGNSNLLLLTDSLSLYYVFHDKILNSDIKTTRYYKKLNLDYPNMTIKYIPTDENYADFLTRNFEVNKQELARIKLPKFKVQDLNNYIPHDTTFTLSSWKEWVDKNPNYLQEVQTASEIKLKAKINFLTNQKARLHQISTRTTSKPDPPPLDIKGVKIKQPKVMLEKLKLPMKSKHSNPKEEEDEEYEILQHNTELQDLPKPSEEKYVDKKLDLTVIHTMTPINILKERLSNKNIINGQKEEYKDIFIKCMQNIGKSTKIDEDTYEIHNNMIMYIDTEDIPRPLLPTNLIGVTVVLYHLCSGHAGYERLYINIKYYYHKHLKAVTRKFTQSCYSCALVNKGTRQQKIGYYPTVKYPFQLAYMDLIEGLPNNQSCKDALMVCCGLSGAIFGFPLPDKNSEQFMFTFMTVIYQIFQPQSLLTDNAKIFRQFSNLKMLSALNVKVFFCSANDPASKGQIEQSNKLIKYIIKKELVKLPNQDWLYLLPLVTSMYNSYKIPKHNYSPFELLFGYKRPVTDLTNLQEEPYLHHEIQIDREEVKNIRKQNDLKLKGARDIVVRNKIKRLEEVNKTRISKKIKPGMRVLVKRTPKKKRKNSEEKKETFLPFFEYSPWLVISSTKTKATLKCIATNAIRRYSLNNVKLVRPQDSEFTMLPLEVQQIISTPDYLPLTSGQLKKLYKNDPFNFLDYEDNAIDPEKDLIEDSEDEMDSEDEEFLVDNKHVSFENTD